MKLYKKQIGLCDFCGSSQRRPVFLAKDYITGQKFWLYRCWQCGLVQTLPRPPKQIMESLYYRNYRQIDGVRFAAPIERFLRACYDLRVGKILKLREKGRILDVGCGRGLEILSLAKKGWQVLGTEISDDLVERLSGRGVSVVKSDIWKIKRAHKFDIITFWHSLEHLYFPKKALLAANTLLGNGGYLIIAVPNFASLEGTVFQEHWFHLDVPRHLFHFSKKNLVNFIEGLGFKLKDQSTFAIEYDFYSFWQSSLNFLFPASNNLVYRLMIGESPSLEKVLIVFLQIPFLIFIFVISIFAVPFLEFLGKSGTMTLVFQKISPIDTD